MHSPQTKVIFAHSKKKRFLFIVIPILLTMLMLLPQAYATSIPVSGIVINTSMTSLFAGSTSAGSDDGALPVAKFRIPVSIAMDSSGNIYVADTINQKIRKITPTGIVSTLAGSGSVGDQNGTGSNASFNMPSGITVDSSGNIYVSELFGCRIRKITPQGEVTTFAGSGQCSYQDGTGTSASFNWPRGMAFDSAGNLYVADTQSNRIRKITSQGVVTTFAGNGSAETKNGTLLQASFFTPSDLVFDKNGNLFVSEVGGNCIRKISPAGMVTTFAGNGTVGAQNGFGTSVAFNIPAGITIDTDGNLYVADSNNHRIRLISPKGLVTTLSGKATSGSKNGRVTAAQFNIPGDVILDANGDLLVADSYNNQIRKIQLNRQIQIETGKNYTVLASIVPDEASNKLVTWSSSNENVATVNEQGLVQAKANGIAYISVTSVDGGYKSFKKIIVSTSVSQVQLSKTTISLNVTQTSTLKATILPSSASNKQVNWNSSNSQIATVDTSGKVTAISKGQSTITVTTQDGSKKATCLVTVP